MGEWLLKELEAAREDGSGMLAQEGQPQVSRKACPVNCMPHDQIQGVFRALFCEDRPVNCLAFKQLPPESMDMCAGS